MRVRSRSRRPTNRFVVQSWDAAFTTLIHETGNLSPPTPNAPSLSYPVSTADWNKIRGDRTAIYIVVRGTQTATPLTGPYDSCAVRLDKK